MCRPEPPGNHPQKDPGQKVTNLRGQFGKSEFVEESNLLVLNKLERLLTVCKVKNIDDIDFRCFKTQRKLYEEELLA